MSNVRKRPDTGHASRTAATPTAFGNLSAETRAFLEQGVERARAAYQDRGCPPWCQHPQQCSDQLWEQPERLDAMLRHEGPVTSIPGLHDGRVELRLLGWEEAGGPLDVYVLATVHDTVRASPAITWSMTPDECAELATELLTFARAARTVTR